MRKFQLTFGFSEYSNCMNLCYSSSCKAGNIFQCADEDVNFKALKHTAEDADVQIRTNYTNIVIDICKCG